jgi:tRNA A-37 threonylcarbamoyl transferase component Bud32
VTRLGRSPLVRSAVVVPGAGSSHAAVRRGDEGGGRRVADSAAGTFVATARRGGSSIGPVVTSSLVAMQEIGRRLEGATLGAYHLEEFVGGGGMGAVFRAHDTTLDRIVAVKVLFAHESADEEVVRRFRNEAQSAARLDHENIGRVHAVGYEEGWHFIVFEFIEGMNLRDIVTESGTFDIRRTVDVTLQLSEALAHAAERDVVHRDIKPSNVIITPDGHAKLVDMGLARLHQVTGGNDLTVSGMTLGTFDYISPEQARDPRAADVRSDLYSLGCTIYFLLAGRPPFAEGTMVQKLLQHQQERAVPVERLRPDTPAALAGAVARLMEKDPADRFQTPEALMAELADLATALGIFVPPERLELPRAAPGRRRLAGSLPWLIPVTGLLAVVAAAWWFEPAAVEPRRAGLDGTAADAGAGPVADERLSDATSDVIQSGPVEAGTPLAPRLLEAGDDERVELGPGVHSLAAPLTVRARSVRLVGAGPGKTSIRIAPAGSTSPAAALRLDDATVSLEGLSLEVEPEAAALVAAEGVFRLTGRSSLVVRDAVLNLRGADGREPIGEEPAVVVVAERSDGIGSASVGTVRFERTTLTADATVLRIDSGGPVEVFVESGGFTTTRRFLLAGGRGGDEAEPPSVALRAEGATFSCLAGFACLLDSQARPVGRRLRAVATDCRFEVPAPAALIEQAGIGEPDGYLLGTVEWTDAGSRYEGSDVFRRIDGAAERVEVDYASSPQPFDRGPDPLPGP